MLELELNVYNFSLDLLIIKYPVWDIKFYSLPLFIYIDFATKIWLAVAVIHYWIKYFNVYKKISYVSWY